MKRYICGICGESFELPYGEAVVCPICKASGDAVTRLDDAPGKLAEEDVSALFNIGYGLYIITSNDGRRDNGMICNTVIQLTSDPIRILVSINKSSYTHDTVKAAGIMNVCPIVEGAPFSVFERFGFKSGRDADKLEGYAVQRSKNGLAVPAEQINSYMSLSVESYHEVETHGIFICSLRECGRTNDEPTMSYAYYHAQVKPKRKPSVSKGFVCRICGWVYEGDTLPEDIVCPICKHGASDFEAIK